MTAIHAPFRRWLYRHGRPNRLARILNRISALQFSSGKRAPRNWVTLEVPGRRSGKPVTFPLVVADHEGERYLVSMLGATSNWVANVRAAGGHAIIHHGKPETVLLTDVDAEARAPILRRYLAVAPGARPHMAVDPRAPLADFDRVAARYPVFHVTHDPSRQTNNPAAVRTGSRLLGAGLILLGTAVATVAMLGPLVSGVLRYRTSPTSLNQIIGGDAAALAVVAPATVAVGVLALRGHRAAPVLALAPSIFVVYTYTQLILGNEFLRWPGNIERFFPLLLAVFLLAATLAIRAWQSTPQAELPATSADADRTAGIVLLAIAAFVVAGLHLPTFVDAMRDQPTSVQYLSSPTAFWLVKFMDLGIVVPAAIAVGIGALRHRQWARKPMYTLVGAYTLIGASVTGMAIVMTARNDPDASAGVITGSALMTALLTVITGYLYRPLFRRHPARSGAPDLQTTAPADPETSTA
ncbi:nitroreductase/quinone reductase family protein [Actinoplanes philippinensis]|uniref:nitroreductase/quinone reductase family protein n=1 Tax=Actinoplanes philippinensis TaxID=35752 RepID=UPI00340472B8